MLLLTLSLLMTVAVCSVEPDPTAVPSPVEPDPNPVKKQYIILKADDLIYDQSNVISPNWLTFIDYIENLEIKAAIGIIGNSLNTVNEEYYSIISSVHKRGNIEFWNHGYDHVLAATRENGEKYWEFKNTSYQVLNFP